MAFWIDAMVKNPKSQAPKYKQTPDIQ